MIVCLDTNIVIYTVEGDPVWQPKVDQRIQEILAAGDTLAASDAARLECLVGPLQSGDAGILADYQKFFASSSIRMLPATWAIWERAARIRASYKFQALDSIHLASAVEHGCGLFLTNDAQLARCTDIKVEVLT
jgi:predicted nucleic acid-binding protein